MSMSKKTITGSAVCTALLLSQLFPAAELPVNALSSNELTKEHNHENFDIRKNLSAVLPEDSQIKAANSFIQESGTGTKISWSSTFGTPSFISKNKGYLTSPSSDNSETIARNWLNKNSQMFGISSGQADSLSVIKNHSIPGNGLQTVVFQQTFSGIESANGGRIIVSVNKDGRILSVASNASRASELDETHKLSSKGYSDAEIAAVVNYVTGRFGARASTITPDQVANRREEK